MTVYLLDTEEMHDEGSKDTKKKDRTRKYAPRLGCLVSALIVSLGCGSLQLYGQDCDLNDMDDAVEIEAGSKEDCNASGIPDICEFVPLVFGESGEPLPSSGEPQVVVSGDLDGDGRSDLIVASVEGADSSTLSLFFSEGTGEFSTAFTIETAPVTALEAVDLDSDSDLDLVTAHGDVVRIHPGDGLGGFAEPLEVATAPGTEGLLVADMNLDWRPDLITFRPTEGTVDWWPTLPDGTVGAAVHVNVPPPAVPGSSRRSLAAGDFDGDGDIDLALAETRDRNIVILANAEGGTSFTPLPSLASIDGSFRSLASADLDGNGGADVIGVTRRFSVLLWRSLEAGGFAEPLKLELRASSLTLTDIDSDGFPDLFAAGPAVGGFRARLLLGRGDGSFRPPQIFETPQAAVVAAGDFDGERGVDLVLATRDRTRVLLQGAREPLVFDGGTLYPGGRAHFLDCGDFNADGNVDVAAATRQQGVVFVLFGRGDGSFGPPYVRDFGRMEVPAIVAVDLNQDGLEDLVVSTRFQEALILLLNDGTGEFTRLPDAPLPLFSPEFLGKGDIDDDGLVDVLVPAGPASSRVAVYFNDGSGELGEARILEAGSSPSSVVAGDLDGDGALDLVSTVVSDVAVSFQDPTGAERGSFAPAVTVPVEGGPLVAVLGDFDLDGDLDVAVGNRTGQDVAVLLNQGGGVLDPRVERFPLGSDLQSLGSADLDADGLQDLIATTLDDVEILRGRGDGAFLRARGLSTGITSLRFTLSVDLDSDDDLDLVVTERNFGVFVLLNQLAATVPPETFLTTLCTPLDFEVVSVPEAEPPAERRTRYLLPVRDDPTLLATLFPNVARFPLEWEFLSEVFPERFGKLSESDFRELALRRASRDYFTGAIRRLKLEDGGTAYGFDVRTEAVPVELLSVEETRAVFERLRQSFLLEPLVYFPTSAMAREAARRWETPGFPLVITDEEVPPGPDANPTFELEIAAGTELCGVFAEGGGDRGARQEYALKSVVRLRPGKMSLPTEEDTFTAELFDEVLFGPERVVIEAQEGGTFRVVRIPGPPDQEDPVATYRFTYSQPFALPDGRILGLEIVSPISFQARGEEALEASRTLPEEFFVALKGREALQATLDGVPTLSYGSCTYASLGRFGIEAELEDGTLLRLEERFEEAASLTDTGPASLVGAEVTLGGETRVVSDYFELIYSASRHNTLVDYWVILEPPVFLDGVEAVHAVELEAEETDPPIARASRAAYLGADLAVIARREVVRFERAALAEVRFLRGDAAGNGNLDVLDSIAMLSYLFERDATLPCVKAADSNDDGRVNIADAIAVVSQLFGRRHALPEPFPNCGPDPTEDVLSCRGQTQCAE